MKFPARPTILILAAATVPASAQPSFRGLGIPQDYAGVYAQTVSRDGLFVAGFAQANSGRFDAFRWTAAGGYGWLGDLPGGQTEGRSTSLSAHGFHVAGEGYSASGTEGFRWQGGSLVGIGDLPGGGFYSMPHAMSAEGTVICGTSIGTIGGGSGYRAFSSVRGSVR